MSLLTKDQILSASDAQFEQIDIPDWGGSVRIRTLTGAERDALESRASSNGGVNTVALVAACICDGDGRRLFTDHEIAALSQKSARPLIKLYAAAAKLNALDPDVVEDMEGN